ncbi:DNA-processing protein DprA [Priestia taiwanensis]|uniref:DNA processing protein DprA n=1 Tax=Priestia taiwanensis TaxID=1347902 RepID=A0A917EP69_9BACI|nr:DNA-processing protein DprA [Priestia taiwanensis]MBM7362854.1 DNA processing protein [Priestia taiwanensis]GGE65675.1 DNA processing protein DprA [Priestia taiwanensis]
MSTIRERLLHLHYLYGDNYAMIQKLLSVDPTLAKIYDMSLLELELYTPLSPSKASKLHHYLQTTSISALQSHLHYHHITYITIYDEEYPPLLKEIPDPPHVLYLQGNSSLLCHPRTLSVVGTRSPTQYAYNGLETLIKQLEPEKWVIVSGLAVGVDTFAHTLAVKHGHATIAVLGSGFEHIYPAANRSLATYIRQHHLLVSEYPPYCPPKRWYFPKRNRIISGLSRGTLIVEAKARSGSLITADCALDQGREVFALPGPITSPYSCGTHYLIQQGAKLVHSVDDITSEFSLS